MGMDAPAAEETLGRRLCNADTGGRLDDGDTRLKLGFWFNLKIPVLDPKP